MFDPRNRLSHWFPRMQSVIPWDQYPKTEIVRVPAKCELIRLLDGEEPPGLDDFIHDLKEAAWAVGGYPAFWRHDLSSCKHNWKYTCLVRSEDGFAQQLVPFLDNWYAASLFGGGEDVWAVREFVPVWPAAFVAFEGMPIGAERRYVIRNGKVTSHFPYWPKGAFGTMNVSDCSNLGQLSIESKQEVEELTALAEAIGAAFPGEDWTVDFMHTGRGWLAIDMALLESSWLPSPQDYDAWEFAINLSRKVYGQDYYDGEA